MNPFPEILGRPVKRPVDSMADALKETRVLGQSEDWFVTALEAVRDYKDIAEEE